MKLLILSLMMMFALVGCVTDKPYAVGKVVYTGARTAYIELPIPENGTLKNVDTVLVQYDKVRTGVRSVIDSKKKEDANTSRQVDIGLNVGGKL